MKSKIFIIFFLFSYALKSRATPPLQTELWRSPFHPEEEKILSLTPGSRHSLPTSIFPTHYDLYLKANMEDENATADANVRIFIHCQSETNNITLHSNFLDINETS